MIKSKLVKIDNQYARDTNTMAIINTDTKAYQQLVESRKNQKTISELENQIDSLKTELGDLKEIIFKIVGSKNG